MYQEALVQGLIDFLGFIAFVTLHEYAHAWMAVRCGDDTPRQQGRLTLDPLVHIDLLGTIILPLVLILSSASSGHAFFFGWGKPVQVNLNNFRVRRRDDILVSAAGPVMNLLLAIVMLGGMRLGVLAGISFLESASFFQLTRLTLLLFFFNLLPIPPLDGGHIVRNLLGISDEAYAQISQYSFIFFILLMRSAHVGAAVSVFADYATVMLASLFGWHFG